MRRVHRNIGVHLDPLRPLLIRLDKKYVGVFIRHERSPFASLPIRDVKLPLCIKFDSNIYCKNFAHLA